MGQPRLAPHPATAAQRKAAPHAATVVQRAQAPDLTEEQSGDVGVGGTLGFTALAAGCLAVAADLDGGGGVGVHMVMDKDCATQWNRFLVTRDGRKVRSITLYGDMLENAGGWHVKIDVALLDPDTSQPPRSAIELKTAGVDTLQEGWLFDRGSLKDWFAAKFGIDKGDVTIQKTRDAVQHKCS